MEGFGDIYDTGSNSYNVYRNKPENLDEKTWSNAIEGEVRGEFFELLNLNYFSSKAQKKYHREKEIVLKSLKALFFEKCPNAALGDSGQIYLFYPVGEDSFYVYTMADGELGFVGAGTVCIITPKNENVLYVFHQKLKSDVVTVEEISIGKIDKAIKNNHLIKYKTKTL
jgi:hypothetical protein